MTTIVPASESARRRVNTGAASETSLSSTSTNSDAEAKRSSGFFARQRWITAPSGAGVPAGSGGASSRKIAWPISTSEGPANGAEPESISCRIEPNAKMSERASAARPRTCSGDM
jgi:hypothetical protein